MKKIGILLYFVFLFAISFLVLIVAKKKYIEYDKYYSFSSNTGDVDFSALPAKELGGFQSQYAVIPAGTEKSTELVDDETFAAIMINNTTREVIVAHNAFKRSYPASITKLMTFILVNEKLEEGNLTLESQVTIQRTPTFGNHTGVMKSPLVKGCSISVRNLLFGLMMRSYNDYAVILAETFGGSEAEFVNMMNQKAKDLGCTSCHFVNPHGIHEDDHYVSAYDLYLIINEAKKYELLRSIDQYDKYIYNYADISGLAATDEIEPTNRLINGDYHLSGNVKIDVWKTGTTDRAKYCINMVTDIGNDEYTIVILGCDTSDKLYDLAIKMLNYAN